MSNSMGKPKRRFWQIHLSTALILMLLSSIFLGLNLGYERNYIIDYDVNPPQPIYRTYRSMGWPIRCDVEPQVVFISDGKNNLPIELPNIDYSFLYADGYIFLGLLASVAFTFESIIRSRENRKP